MSKDKPINDKIRARRIKLINESGENLGEMSIGEGRQLAQESELDLMQMSYNGDTAVVKLLDYGKHLYKEKKQRQKNRQRTKTADLKTIKITFKISEHDLDVKRNQAKRFSEAGHPLKVSLMLRGRENQYTSLARDKMKHFIEMLSEFYRIDKPVSQAGNNFYAMMKINK